VAVYLDRHNIMAAVGVLARQFPEAAATLLLESIGVADSSQEGAQPDGNH